MQSEAGTLDSRYLGREGDLGPVTKIENIKTDATKILRPTHFGE